MKHNQRTIIHERRTRRQLRVRKRLAGTAERPRLAVFRSSKHIYVQIVDDERGATLASASSLDPELRKTVSYGGNVAAAAAVGKLAGERAKAAGIERVCFDRRSYRYHGRVKALADGAREAGLQF